jgi:hypothetical protein
MTIQAKLSPVLFRFITLLVALILFSTSACTLIQDFIPNDGGEELNTEETLEAYIAETLSAQQTNDHFQATISALQMTNDAQTAIEVEQPTYTPPPTETVADTATPTIPPSPTVVEASPTSITEWDMLYWRPLPSGCHFEDMVCWRLFDDFKTTGGKADAVLTSKNAVYIEENWNSPYLVFWHEPDLRYTAYLNLRVDGTPTTVKDFSKSSGMWKQAYVDLSQYKGKNVIVQFISIVGEKRISYWLIQDVQIVPDFTPPK